LSESAHAEESLLKKGNENWEQETSHPKPTPGIWYQSQKKTIKRRRRGKEGQPAVALPGGCFCKLEKFRLVGEKNWKKGMGGEIKRKSPLNVWCKGGKGTQKSKGTRGNSYSNISRK